MTGLVDDNSPAGRGGKQRSHPTLETVAALAGVSRATVSRVLNGSNRVSPDTHRVVMEAMTETGYSPNLAARSLVTRRSDSIALVVSESERRLFADPFFGEVVSGVMSELANTDLQLILTVAHTPAERQRLERYAASRHIDGALLISSHGDDELPHELERAGVPVVLAGRPTGRYRACYVDSDNLGGAHSAVSHLIELGHRRIGTVAGPLDMSAGRDRLEGYYEALRDAALPIRESHVAVGDFGEESGTVEAARLLEQHPDLDALFVASDLMAAGALRYIRRSGRSTPGDISVVGFDDSVTSRQTNPPLTTVRQAIDELGREMTRLLLARIGGNPVRQAHIVLHTQLVVRNSTGGYRSDGGVP